jgi:HAD superfamily hydrolase (TIGR01509 family)
MHQLDAILFDMGGTLDGRGAWRDRFERLFAAVGVVRSRHERMRAFDYAERRSHTTDAMLTARLGELVTAHVGWQFEELGVDDPAIAQIVVERFVSEAAAAAAANRHVLAQLAARGLKLGLVSNACGNASAMCEEWGFAPHLSVVVDSHRVGVAKPDPDIFWHALRALDVPPVRAGFVGDSLDRDMKPAKSLGMWTCWVTDRPVAAAASPFVDAAVDDVGEVPARVMEIGCSR